MSRDLHPKRPVRTAPPPAPGVVIRTLEPGDFPAIQDMGRRIYPMQKPWGDEQLRSHLRYFPEGQLVAADPVDGRVVGMASSLIINWDEYAFDVTWSDFTEKGTFSNHDPEHGRTLYGADLMVDPDTQGKGVGKAIYKAREDLCRRLGLRRIRAHARLAGYHVHAKSLSPREYVIKVIAGELGDPTLSFQLKRGFRVIAVTGGYLTNDPDSLGYAAVIEWINHQVAHRRDYSKRDPAFGKPRNSAGRIAHALERTHRHL